MINVYDFDGTIYGGDVTIDYLIFNLKLKPLLLFKAPLFLYQLFLVLIKYEDIKDFKEFLLRQLIPSNHLKANLKQFWVTHSHKIKDFYYKQKDSSDLIISASPYFLIEPIAKELNVNLLATQYDLVRKKIIGHNLKGQHKVTLFSKTFPNTTINRFYSDSWDDLPLAKISHQPYLVTKNSISFWDTEWANTHKSQNNFLSLDFLRFIFSGGMGTLSNFIVSSIFSFNVDPLIAYIFGYSSSLIVTYYLASKIIFEQKLSLMTFLKFSISYIPNFMILFIFVVVLIDILGFNPILTYGLAGLFGLPITFVLVKIYAFNKKE